MSIGRPLLAVLVALAAAIMPISAAAYDGNAAANHADDYATRQDTAYPTFPEDCTNFVSQNLHVGGYPYRNFRANTFDDHNWWWDFQSQTNTNSWSAVTDFRTFIYVDYPGGWPRGSTTGNSNRNAPWNRWPSGTAGLVRGDVLFYDWGQGQGWSHDSMLVTLGGYSFQNNWYGDLVDAHSNYRYHAFWDESEYNNYASTTTVEAWHIDAGN